MLSAHDITKRYGKVPVLDGISLDIAPGTITTIIGPSGAGKSTLLRTLALLDAPDRGRVTVDGLEFAFPVSRRRLNPTPPWPALTVVFQQLFLWPNMTLRANIMLPLQRLRGDAAEMIAANIIADVGIADFVDRFPNEVSIGQRQLAAIARALALDPSYLLLDEITSALDVEYVARLLGILRRRRESGVGILLVTHFVGFAKRSADQVIFLDHSQILEVGTSDILTSPRTKRLEEFLSLAMSAT